MEKEAMYKLSYGLFVLTAKDEKDNGCIINTAMQITTTPNRMIITVNKGNYTHDMIKKTGAFNVSVLAQNCDFSVFRHFGFQSGRDVDKFADFTACSRADNGIMYVTEGTNAYLSGKVVETLDCGTHTMFVADVTDGKVLSSEKSVTYDYYQSNIKPKPEKTEKKGWRCKICGYVYEGGELPEDFICPICKHGAADFEKIV